jgi:predicted dehydrogenase
MQLPVRWLKWFSHTARRVQFMDNSTPCQLGLVGCGRWGKYILRDLIELGSEVWVVARDVESRSAATQVGAAHVVPCIGELPDFLAGYVVATPTATHYEVIEQLASRGKPIYCEKPLTNDLAKAQDIVSRWGELVFVMDKWRYHPAIEQMRLWVQSGTLGPLQSIRTRRLQWGSPHTDADAPWILMPHDLSIVRHILGELPTIERCYGTQRQGEILSLTAVLTGQADCVLEVSTFSPVAHRRVEIQGEKGAAVLEDTDYGHIQWNHEESLAFGQPPEKFTLSNAMPLAAELAAFVNYVQRAGDPPLTSAADGLESVAYISKMIEMVKCRSLP